MLALPPALLGFHLPEGPGLLQEALRLVLELQKALRLVLVLERWYSKWPLCAAPEQVAATMHCYWTKLSVHLHCCGSGNFERMMNFAVLHETPSLAHCHTCHWPEL